MINNMVNYNSTTTSSGTVKTSEEEIQMESDLAEIRLDDPTSSTVDTISSSDNRNTSSSSTTKQMFHFNLCSCLEGNKEVLACCLIKIPEAGFMATSSIFLSTAFIKVCCLRVIHFLISLDSAAVLLY